MTTYAAEEEELVELEENISRKKSDVADAELRKSMGREGAMIDISDNTETTTLWSMVDGMRITIPDFMVAATLRKRLPGSGQRAFTSDRNRAPKWKEGSVKCWLHRDHEKRSEWDEAGVAGIYCPAEHLASPYSARIHMQHRHKNEWAAIEEYQKELERKAERESQRQQLEATLALAGRASTGKAPTSPEYDQLTCECGWVTPPDKQPGQSLAFHKRMHCPLRHKEE